MYPRWNQPKHHWKYVETKKDMRHESWTNHQFLAKIYRCIFGARVFSFNYLEPVCPLFWWSFVLQNKVFCNPNKCHLDVFKAFYGFYHGKSPVHHHLGNMLHPNHLKRILRYVCFFLYFRLEDSGLWELMVAFWHWHLHWHLLFWPAL